MSDVEKLVPETSIVVPTDPELLLKVMLGDALPIMKVVDAESPFGLPTAVIVYEPVLAEFTVNDAVKVPLDIVQV